MADHRTYDLVHPVAETATAEQLDDPRGYAGRRVRYGLADASVRATLIELMKLAELSFDAQTGIAATDDLDAAAHAIAFLFDLTTAGEQAEQWKPDLAEHLELYRSPGDWETTPIKIDGRVASARSLPYRDAVVFLHELDDRYLIIAMRPAVTIPEVATR
ncbi:hypothetical protein [Actinoplanes sp. NPDC049118]|uniref:hypothetical protein n=1 Tax=Actinoplanes sp. NPDC049118 TaxID=3155769 RepID=UPI0033EE7BC0